MRGLLPLVQRWLAGASGGAVRPTPRPLLTPRETDFWRLLRLATDPLHVAPQVAMGALLDAGSGGRRTAFDRKVVDFVLVDNDGGVRLLVELDDRLHDRRRDAVRDAMTAVAGYRTLRIDGVVARDLRLLTDAIDAALGRSRRWTPPVGLTQQPRRVAREIGQHPRASGALERG